MRSASRLHVWFWTFAAVAAAAGPIAPGLYRTAVLGSGFLAQRLCGDVFISKRDPDAVLAEDLWPEGERVDRTKEQEANSKVRGSAAQARQQRCSGAITLA
jgi:hypothetical protein